MSFGLSHLLFMEHVEDLYKAMTDRELLIEVLNRLSKIESRLDVLNWDLDVIKSRSQSENTGNVGSLGGYNSSMSGYKQ